MDLKSSKAQNLLRIISLLQQEREMTRQELASALGISMPTVLHCIEELKEAGILTETGKQASTGGRRAGVLSLDLSCGFGIGIQIARRFVEFALTDMTGRILCTKQLAHSFKDQTAWYRKLGALLLDFLTEEKVDGRKIIGVGISFPGIIDQEGQMILHSHVFHLTNISLDRFYRYIPFPLVISNDANCACRAEQRGGEDSYLYISLNETVGGALMVNQDLYTGRRWQAGEVGHMILHPGGRTCYCGKSGCADAYLTAELLMAEGTKEEEEKGKPAENGEDLSGQVFFSDQDKIRSFFQCLEAGDQKAAGIFTTYLNDLAILVSNVRMLLDMDIVIGGNVGACMEEHIDELAELTETYDLFCRDVDYISACRCKDHIFSKGAALQAVRTFSDRLVEKL